MIDYDKHNWYDHLFDLEGSMVREILGRVSACVVWALVVCAIQFVLKKNVSVAPLPHTLVGLALGLLLVFRTNASYDRYWEGRRLWGGIINESRNLARGAHAYLAGDAALVRTILDWTAAFPYAAMNHLRGQPGLGPGALRLPTADTQAISGANHVPLAVALRISEALVAARDKGLISDYVMMSLDQNVQQLIDYMGGCERIHKTPLPFVYVVHLRRALIIYCFTLPFAVVEPFRWLSIVVTFFIAYVFFGIEEIGVEIEDPFGHDTNDLPLEQFCATIEKNVLSLGSRSSRNGVPREADGKMRVEEVGT